MALRAHLAIPSELTPEQAFESDTGIIHALLSGDPTLTVCYWITTRSIIPTFARNRLKASYNVLSYTPFSSEAVWICLHPDQAISNNISFQINKINPKKIPLPRLIDVNIFGSYNTTCARFPVK